MIIPDYNLGLILVVLMCERDKTLCEHEMFFCFLDKFLCAPQSRHKNLMALVRRSGQRRQKPLRGTSHLTAVQPDILLQSKSINSKSPEML